jgi:phage-related protein
MQARLIRVTELIRIFGLNALREPQVKHLTGKLWEIRLSGRSGIGRVIYAAAIGQRVVLLRAFIKKTQTTPKREIEIALERLKELKA